MFDKLIKDGFARHVLTLVSGTAVSQAIPILLMPLLTRIYGPTDFAILATFTAFSAVIGTVIAGRYDIAIMQAKDGVEEINLVQLSLLVTLGSSLIIGAALWFFSAEISGFIRKPTFASWMPWLCISLACTGVVQIFTTWLNRSKQYKHIAGGRILQNTGGNLVSVLVGWFRLGSGGLVLGYVFGFVVAALYLGRKNCSRLTRFSFQNLLIHAKKYRSYPLFSTPAALLDVASLYATVFILGRYYSAEMLGYFALAHRMLIIPLALIGTSIGQVFFQDASERFRSGLPIRPLLMATTRRMLLVSFPGLIIFIGISPALFAWAFGADWRTAGEYASIAAVGYWIRFGVSPISYIFYVTQRIRLGTLWQILYFCTSYGVLTTVALNSMPIEMFFGIFAVHELVLYGIYFLLARYACSVGFEKK